MILVPVMGSKIPATWGTWVIQVTSISSARGFLPLTAVPCPVAWSMHQGPELSTLPPKGDLEERTDAPWVETGSDEYSTISGFRCHRSHVVASGTESLFHLHLLCSIGETRVFLNPQIFLSPGGPGILVTSISSTRGFLSLTAVPCPGACCVINAPGTRAEHIATQRRLRGESRWVETGFDEY